MGVCRKRCRPSNDMKSNKDDMNSSIKLSTKFKGSGISKRVKKKDFGCVAEGCSGQDCVATERIEMFFKKARFLKE